MKTVLSFLLTLCCIQYSSAQECLNIRYQLRSSCYAGTSLVDSAVSGGFEEFFNSPKALTPSIASYTKPNALQVVVRTDLTTIIGKNVQAFHVLVVNTSDSISRLPAQDGRLYLIRQVFYKDQWRDIEYLPSSWCGNSYYDVLIQPQAYWTFEVPCLRGRIRAKFRYKLSLEGDKANIYSNEFKGSFNKKQLTKRRAYESHDLMDPCRE